MLEYGHWTLLSFGNGLAQSDPIADLVDGDVIHRVEVDRLDISETGKRALRELCGIGAAGQILIRPDGHVALRETNTLSNTSDYVEAAE